MTFLQIYLSQLFFPKTQWNLEPYMQRLSQVSIVAHMLMLQSWWILPVEEWINRTDGIKGYYERQNSQCASLSWWNKIISPLTEESSNKWDSATKHKKRECRNKMSKNQKTANWCFKVHMENDYALIKKLLSKNTPASTSEMAMPCTHTCSSSVSEGVVVLLFLNQSTETIWLLFFKV